MTKKWPKSTIYYPTFPILDPTPYSKLILVPNGTILQKNPEYTYAPLGLPCTQARHAGRLAEVGTSGPLTLFQLPSFSRKKNYIHYFLLLSDRVDGSRNNEILWFCAVFSGFVYFPFPVSYSNFVVRSAISRKVET